MGCCQLPGGGRSVTASAVCSSSYSLTCTTCEAGLQRTTPSRLLSLINFKQTQRPDTAIHALNSKINAYFHPSVNKRRKALAGRRESRAERRAQHNTVIRKRALMRIITLSVVNKAKHEPSPLPEQRGLYEICQISHYRNTAGIKRTGRRPD